MLLGFHAPFYDNNGGKVEKKFAFSFTEPQSLLHDEEEEIVDLLRKHMEMGDAEAIYSI